MLEAGDHSWRRASACVGQHDLFWPAPSEGAEERFDREARALAVCAACPVVEPCRDWARAHHEPGIWGGETQEQRAAAGYRPVVPGVHIDDRRRRAAERDLRGVLATGDLTVEQLEAIRLITQGDPRCS